MRTLPAGQEQGGVIGAHGSRTVDLMARRAVISCLAAGIALVTTLVALPLSAAGAGPSTPSLAVFERLGAWIDVFDYAPRLQQAGDAPRITPDSVSDMAALGVKTLYVQVANPDGTPSNQLTDRTELRALLDRAHDHDMDLVPWFLPAHTNPADDVAMLKQIFGLRAGGERGRRDRSRPGVERGRRHRAAQPPGGGVRAPDPCDRG